MHTSCALKLVTQVEFLYQKQNDMCSWLKSVLKHLKQQTNTSKLSYHRMHFCLIRTQHIRFSIRQISF